MIRAMSFGLVSALMLAGCASGEIETYESVNISVGQARCSEHAPRPFTGDRLSAGVQLQDGALSAVRVATGSLGRQVQSGPVRRCAPLLDAAVALARAEAHKRSAEAQEAAQAARLARLRADQEEQAIEAQTAGLEGDW